MTNKPPRRRPQRAKGKSLAHIAQPAPVVPLFERLDVYAAQAAAAALIPEVEQLAGKFDRIFLGLAATSPKGKLEEMDDESKLGMITMLGLIQIHCKLLEDLVPFLHKMTQRTGSQLRQELSVPPVAANAENEAVDKEEQNLSQAELVAKLCLARLELRKREHDLNFMVTGLIKTMQRIAAAGGFSLLLDDLES